MVVPVTSNTTRVLPFQVLLSARDTAALMEDLDRALHLQL